MQGVDGLSPLDLLKIIAALATIVTGLVSLIAPRSVKGFTGLDVPGARGITEIRAVLGGAFIGLGAAPLILELSPASFRTLGIMYLAIFVARIIGMIVDKSWVRSNWISLATEIVLGVILVL